MHVLGVGLGEQNRQKNSSYVAEEKAFVQQVSVIRRDPTAHTTNNSNEKDSHLHPRTISTTMEFLVLPAGDKWKGVEESHA